jgi:hypothetical protein
MTPLRWALTLLLLGTTAASHAQWRENGAPVPETSWRKDWGDFGVMMLHKPDELFAAWEEPGAGVPVTTIEMAKRGVGREGGTVVGQTATVRRPASVECRRHRGAYRTRRSERYIHSEGESPRPGVARRGRTDAEI